MPVLNYLVRQKKFYISARADTHVSEERYLRECGRLWLIICARGKSAPVLANLRSVPMTMYSITQLVLWDISMNKSVEDVVVDEIRKHAVSNKLNRDMLLTTLFGRTGHR